MKGDPLFFQFILNLFICFCCILYLGFMDLYNYFFGSKLVFYKMDI